MGMTQILQNLKKWRYRTVSDWNISSIKQCWRYLHSGETSVGQQNWTAGRPLKNRTAGDTPSPHHYFVKWLWQILISEILIQSDVQMSRYFLKIAWPHHDDMTCSLGGGGGRGYLDFSPNSCIIQLWWPSRSEDNFNFTLILPQFYLNNCPVLFCTFTIDNSSFLTTIMQKVFSKTVYDL